MYRSLVLDPSVRSRNRAVPLADWREDEKLLLCSRLTPPPVPPWLLHSPDKLRHKVANCSAWQTYSKLCAKDLKENYPALWTITQSDRFQGAIGSQWIPTMVMLILTAMMFLVVFCGYFLYRHKGLCKWKTWQSVKYKRQMTPSTSRDYCSPGLSLTPSVTVETQLSLWALEDHSPFNVHTPFTLDADPSLAILTSSPSTSCWSVSRSENYTGSSPTEEVLLQPRRLADAHLPVMDVLPNSSIRSHPIETYSSLETSQSEENRANVMTERYCEFPVRNRNENIISTQNWSEGDVNFQRSSQSVLLGGKRKSLRSPNNRPSILKTCQNAGAKLVTKLSRRPSFDKTKQGQSTSQRIEASLARFRHSLMESKFPRRRSHNRKPSSDQTWSDPNSLPNSGLSGNQIGHNPSSNESPVYHEDGRSVGLLTSQTNPNVSRSTPSIAASSDGIYSYASNIPNDSDDVMVVTRTKPKRPTSLLIKRPNFLKNHKFFSKS